MQTTTQKGFCILHSAFCILHSAFCILYGCGHHDCMQRWAAVGARTRTFSCAISQPTPSFVKALKGPKPPQAPAEQRSRVVPFLQFWTPQLEHKPLKRPSRDPTVPPCRGVLLNLDHEHEGGPSWADQSRMDVLLSRQRGLGRPWPTEGTDGLRIDGPRQLKIDGPRQLKMRYIHAISSS